MVVGCYPGDLEHLVDTFNKHLQLQAEAKVHTHTHTRTDSHSDWTIPFFQVVNQDAEILRQIVDQIRSAHPPSGTNRTNNHPPSGSSIQLRPLRALTQQLKRTSSAALSCPHAPPSGSTEEADRATQVLEELQTLRMKIDSNLQLLEPFVTFLRTSYQVRIPDPGKSFLFSVQDSTSRASQGCCGVCSHKI